MSESRIVGVVGAGTMGRGIAQVAATAGHEVILYDQDAGATKDARESLERIHARLVEKEKIDRPTADAILGRITFATKLHQFRKCSLVIEAIIEKLDVKQAVFRELESLTDDTVTLATNTSSLSVTSIAGACQRPDRVIGMHFFNPAPLLPLVEIVPALTTDSAVTEDVHGLVGSWRKVPVVAKDTPGFIVNRVARPFYGEAIRMLEEGVADAATIDWAMRDVGDFRMGPFQLMDLIGNDVNLTVTETVFEAFFYDPRFKPSFTQKRLVEAGRLGRKSGRGYFAYGPDAQNPSPVEDRGLGETIVDRVVALLINEAADAVFMNVASPRDVDLAMTKGVNYPKGLLAWAEEIGLPTVLERLEALQAEYGEDRYRPCPLLRRLVRDGKTFHG